MHDCIFTAHCTEHVCDRSCPILAETSYLLERNGIDLNSKVFDLSAKEIFQFQTILDKSIDSVGVMLSDNTVVDAEKLTFVAICNNWEHSQLHCTVYNLKFSKYLEEIKKSWNTHVESETLEYMRIWLDAAKVLIISNFDYVNFGDFESQMMLTLLQDRQARGKTTIFVSPPLDMLVSSKASIFFNNLKLKFTRAVKVVSE